ncbi:ABC transporter ATP-binding protein [Acidianus sp. HS-5]|uniref:ABC transporter ATP-binding protein n=1 Tax=Acidianus sp. HS-5 TaxID=2886040 RepID=UPI001F1BD0E2|nr:ABC transporter ATP-binding protein [Acidianus sp. HS-5]BDC18558.1 ABC transporter ATP-binding protein [Acidianus sp. HS-5]
MLGEDLLSKLNFEHGIINVENLWIKYPLSRGIFSKVYLYAVNGVSFSIQSGEILGLIGESGSGKTTLGRGVLKLLDIEEGKVFWGNIDVTKLKESKLRKLRRYFQLIQQDPYGALDPRMRIYDAVAEGLRVHKLVHSREEEEEIVYRALEQVKLTPPEAFAYKMPDELSGGQRQRVVIARALVLKPKFMVADEPISMLDASTRGQILEILNNARSENNLSILFITHDIAIASYISNKIMVLYSGKVVEISSSEEIIKNPMHPYTQALIEAIPRPDPNAKVPEPKIKGEVVPLLDKPKGCVFYNRCPFAMPVCKEKEPELKEVKSGHYVACHLY